MDYHYKRKQLNDSFSAAAISGWDHEVTMVFPESHLMQRLFPESIASWFELEFKKRGINFMKGAKVEEISKLPEENAHQITLSTGMVLKAEIVVAGLGAKPNTELLSGKVELAKDGGVIVDAGFKTSDPFIHAFGDVASFPREYDSVGRFEHVSNCRQSASHLVQTLLGKTTAPYDYLPYFYSRLFEYTDTPIIFQFYGETRERLGEEGLSIQSSLDEPLKPRALWKDSNGLVRGGLVVNGSDEDYAAIKTEVANNLQNLASQHSKL